LAVQPSGVNIGHKKRGMKVVDSFLYEKTAIGEELVSSTRL
jgi:hypothetical protein